MGNNEISETSEGIAARSQVVGVKLGPDSLDVGFGVVGHLDDLADIAQ